MAIKVSGTTVIDDSRNVNVDIITATTFVGALTGTASNVTTNANLTGDVTSSGNATSIAAGVIVNADINASAGIVDTKLATISTALKVSNSATTATNANTASAIVARDASGNFTAGTITANLIGYVIGTATSMATLTTARTINGISFNGSANIITNPSTGAYSNGNGARTLQLGGVPSGGSSGDITYTY
jgi:hypothetical protein